MAKSKNYQIIEEAVEKKSGVQDYVTGQWVRSGVKEHKEAVNVFTIKLIEDLGYSKKTNSDYSTISCKGFAIWTRKVSS